MSNNLYQYSILSALMKGICKKGICASRALKQGTYGLGTVCNLNGEVIILESQIYHFPPDEALHLLKENDILPFIMITDFNPTLTKSLSSLTMLSLHDALHPLLPAQQNRFVSTKIDGCFTGITFRVIERQSDAGETLAELSKRQRIFHVQDTAGTMFGFWSPSFSGGFSVTGFHLHFLSEDRKVGGHVLNFEIRGARLEAAAVEEYRVELPSDEEFNRVVIGSVDNEELHKVR